MKLGHEELIIRRRYELISIGNDFFIAIWFLAGSILFLFPKDEKASIWLFIIGSLQFVVSDSPYHPPHQPHPHSTNSRQ
ncbi:YrhK family protein [Halomonas sp. CKK8]|uniref:YrhK family protein n=1 Tax=Halomonas sp. CKK8 TaxID=3036127 RepID=UPI002414EABA|nr:YrhK family protein [Halomonas sp. CKK8]WFM71125.1 YrhK family protein [Halomonas sp. CKK8]